MSRTYSDGTTEPKVDDIVQWRLDDEWGTAWGRGRVVRIDGPSTVAVQKLTNSDGMRAGDVGVWAMGSLALVSRDAPLTSLLGGGFHG